MAVDELPKLGISACPGTARVQRWPRPVRMRGTVLSGPYPPLAVAQNVQRTPTENSAGSRSPRLPESLAGSAKDAVGE